MSKRTAIIIIGMHRSGTSALAGSLKNAGISTGANTIEPAFDNKKGFFENQDILVFNSNVLKKINTNWQIPFFNKSALGEKICTPNYINELKEIIEEQYKEESIFVIKDPRISLLVSLYAKTFAEMDIDCKFLIQQRDINAIFNSLISRNDFDKNKCAILWLTYYMNAEFLTRGNQRIFVQYEELLKGRASEIKSILEKLNIDHKFDDTQKQAIEQFLDEDLNNNKGTKSKKINTRFSPEINKVTEAIGKLQDSKRSHKTVFKSLDKTYQDLEELSSAFYDNLVYNNNTSLVYHLLNAEKEILYSQKMKINTDILELDIEIDKAEIAFVKIYPSSQFCHFAINAVEANDVLINQSELIQFDSAKKIIEHGQQFIIESLDYIQFKRLDPNTRIKLHLDLQYHSFGLNTLKNVRFISNMINDWFYNKLDIANTEKEEASFQLDKLKKSRAINEKNEDQKLQKLNQTIELLRAGEKNHSLEIEKLQQGIALKDTIIQNQNPDSGQDQKISELENNRIESLLSLKEYEVKLKYIEKELHEKRALLESKESLLDTEKQKRENLFSDYKTSLETNIEKDQTIESLEDEINVERQEKVKLKKQLINLGEENLDINERIKSYKEQVLEFENNIKSLQDEIDHYQEDIKVEKEKNSAAEETISGQGEKLAAVTKIYEELNHKEIKLREQNELLLEQLKKQKSKLSDIENNNTSLKDEVYNLKNEIGVLNEIISNYHNKVARLNSVKRDMIFEIEAIKKSISYKLGFGATWPARKIYDVANRKAENQKQLNLFLASLASRQEDPSLFLRSLSTENLTALSKALKKEDPKTIVQNLEKYIGGNVAIKNKLLQNKQPQLNNNNSKVETEVNTVSLPDGEVERPKILYISPNLPDFDTSSGGKRATRMIGLMAEEFDVYVFTLGAQQQKYIDKLESLGAYVVRGFSFNELRKKIKNFQSIIFSFYYTYYDYNRFISLYPNAKIIIDSVDVHWVREERSLGIWDQLTPEKVETNKRREINAYKNADFIWAVTDNDKAFIEKEVPKVAVKVVSNVHSPIRTTYKDSNNNDMLFIGGFNHYPNISAVKLVAEEILPIVNKEIKDARLIIAGANAPEEVVALKKLPNVVYRGFIEEEEMDELYDQTFISVCPVLAGAGIKGKVCEAISYMTPVATNAIGNEGVNLINKESGIIGEDYSQMAMDIISFMKRGIDIAPVTKKAQENLYNLVGPEIVKTRMLNSILPEVSICIVTWNRIELLKRCIESIEGNTKYPNYKILVHSNGCEDGTQSYLEAAAKVNKKIVPVLSKENQVFVIPNNNMAAMFPENDVILLNNDTYVTDGWLYALFDAAYSSTEIGLAGSKILYPDGRLQEFGSELYEDGTGKNIGKFDDPNKEDYKRIKRVGYVSGCSLYVKRSTIDKIGLFDIQFHPCYCEDSDLCYTAWEQGLQTVVTPHSIIYHDEGGTSGTDEEKGFKAYQKVNFEKFLDKHKSNLKEIQHKIQALN